MALLTGWKICPRCGSGLNGDETSMSCDSCGSRYYAHSVPAVSAIVMDEQGRVLLARRAYEPDAGRWDTPGGFVDEGEAPRDAIRRELQEETGLGVEPMRFLDAVVDTYGDGPRAASVLNLVWEATIVGGEMEPADDVSELRWFSPQELPSDEGEYAFRWVAPFLRRWAATQLPK